MARRFDVMVAGHLCIDIIPRFPDTGVRDISELMRPGKLVNVAEATISTGGPVSNTGINMKTLGNRVCFCACVGDDALGRMTIGLLKASGHAEGVRTLSGATSSYTIVVAPPGIDRIFLHNPGTNNVFGAENLDPRLIRQCRHFHFGYPPLMNRMFADAGAELEKIFKLAKAAGATTSCDMTLPDPASPSGKAPWRKILRRILPHVDVYLPSAEETFYMLWPDEFLARKKRHKQADLLNHFTPEEYSVMADEVLAMGTRMVALKSGHRGFYLKTSGKAAMAELDFITPRCRAGWADRELWTPAFAVDHFGSATGSGDSAIAGFLSALLRGLPIEATLKYATCCGLQNVRVLDAVSGIKPWDETTRMLKRRMPMLDLKITGEGWRYSKKAGLWAGPGDPLAE
ncbi:MAG: carbohydrate kinase family protein [bacterium]